MDSNSFLYKSLLKVIPSVFYVLIHLWFTTCRIRVHGKANREYCVKLPEPTIATFWHYSIVYIFYHVRKDPAVAMVSSSKDGEFISRIANKLGFETVRGSRNSRGLSALKGLIRAIRKGKNSAIVADGSQGPQQQVQAGSILLASQTGSPILPLVWSASSYKCIKSWDRTAIPMPFSVIDFFYGEPLHVPPSLSQEQIEEYRIKLEQSLHSLYQEAWALYGKKSH